MPKFDLKTEVATAKVWATSHLVLALAIGVSAGLLIGLLIG